MSVAIGATGPGVATSPPLEIFNTQTIPGITFPIDLNPIHINYTITKFQDITKLRRKHFQEVDINYINNMPHTINNVADGSILYTLNARIGKGSYGSVYSMTETTSGNKICCKIQDANIHNTFYKIVSESIVQYIIYETTKNNDHYDCVYTPKVHSVFYDESKHQIVIIQDLVHGGIPFGNLLYSNLRQTNINFYNSIFIRIARKLQNLWRLYNFNHGDFHSGNILIVNGNPRLIDFGRSSITIPWGTGANRITVEIPGPYQITVDDEARDLTQLFASIVRFYGKSASIFGNPIIQSAYINTGIETALQSFAGIASPPHFGCYDYFNGGNTVEPAKPTNILNTFNTISPIGDDTAHCFGKEGWTGSVLNLARNAFGAAGREAYAAIRRAAEADVPLVREIIQIDPHTNNIKVNTYGVLAIALGVTGIIYARATRVGGTRKRVKYHKQKTMRMRGGRSAAVMKYNKDIGRLNTLLKDNMKKLNARLPQLKAKAVPLNSPANSTAMDAEAIMNTSAEYILDYIRFNVFPEVDTETMRAVLINLATIPLRKPEIAQSLADCIRTKSFENLINIVTKYTPSSLMRLLTAQNWPMNKKNIKTAIDIYMSDSKPETAIKLLRAYIYANFQDKENHDAFVEWVMTLDEMGRKYAIHDYHPDAFKI